MHIVRESVRRASIPSQSRCARDGATRVLCRQVTRTARIAARPAPVAPMRQWDQGLLHGFWLGAELRTPADKPRRPACSRPRKMAAQKMAAPASDARGWVHPLVGSRRKATSSSAAVRGEDPGWSAVLAASSSLPLVIEPVVRSAGCWGRTLRPTGPWDWSCLLGSGCRRRFDPGGLVRSRTIRVACVSLPDLPLGG